MTEKNTEPEKEVETAPVTQEAEPSTPDVSAERQVETPAEAEPEEALFSDEDVDELNRKVDKENYEPTDEDYEKYRKWKGGKKRKAKEVEPVPAVVEEAKPTEETPKEDKLSEALALVGAKSPDELADKIKGLQKAMTSSGGKLGDENKRLKEGMANLEASLKAMLSGDQTAMDRMRQAYGIPPAPKEEVIPDEVADTGTYRLLKKDFQEISEQVRALREEAARAKEAAEMEKVHLQAVSELTDLSRKYPELAPKTKDLGVLLREFWSGSDEDPVDEELQPIIDLIRFARENGIANLEHAHIVKERDKWEAKRLAELKEAEQRALQKLTQHPPTVGLAATRATGTTDSTYSPVSEEEIRMMLAGEMDIPSEWKDESGRFVRSRVPKSAWGVVFGD